MQIEAFARGRQHPQMRPSVQEFPNHERAIDQPLEVIQHEQDLPIAEMMQHLVQDRKPWTDRDPA
ncbi:MAG: hypothetical protein IPO29_03695 [Anaerolineae bacterium]|nr:hypothetical protein [Anaerolineae bacterium]